MTTTMASLPFLPLSPFFRRFFDPRALRRVLPRCRWQPQPQLSLCWRLPRRLANSASVAIGGHLPSSSMTSTSPSPGGAANCCMNGAACRPRPSTTCSMVSLAGDQRSIALQTSRAAPKLMRVASRPTRYITQGDKRSRVKPSTASRG